MAKDTKEEIEILSCINKGNLIFTNSSDEYQGTFGQYDIEYNSDYLIIKLLYNWGLKIKNNNKIEDKIKLSITDQNIIRKYLVDYLNHNKEKIWVEICNKIKNEYDL